MTNILVLCTANLCRSVMAEAFLARHLATEGVVASVSSAGMLRAGDAPPAEVSAAMAAYGLDTTSQRSRVLGKSELVGSDLVLAMAREHLRRAVVALPGVWPRAFTLKELVRRGHGLGPRRPGEALASWIARAHDGRDRHALLGDCAEDDVADPIGGPSPAYAATAAELDLLLRQLVDLAWGQERLQ